jgi:hypothetical protein
MYLHYMVPQKRTFINIDLSGFFSLIQMCILFVLIVYYCALRRIPYGSDTKGELRYQYEKIGYKCVSHK